MATQEVDLNSVRPKEYLRNGFVDNQGELRDGISGVYSLALAYLLSKEGMTAETMKSILEDFTKLADQGLSEKTSHSQLDAKSFELLGKTINSHKVEKSEALKSLFDAALPSLKDWPNVAGLVIHLNRAMKQLALITVTNRQ